MKKLEKLKQKCNQIWSRAMSSKSKSFRDKFLEEYRGVYEEYKKHKEWLKLLEA